MLVTPLKKFGKYKPGDVFTLPDGAAKVYIKVGKLKKAEAAAVPAVVPEAPVSPAEPEEVEEAVAPTYETRMLTAAAPEPRVKRPYVRRNPQAK